MTKWFLYIVLLMLFAPLSSYPEVSRAYPPSTVITTSPVSIDQNFTFQQRDTTVTKGRQKPSEEEKKKIKEIAKAKKMPKPEKIDEVKTDKPKRQRQRRPEGLERPPEIPRRNE
ncbi:hypothetical protein FPZ42_17160 [Mucilaginibacter achroorhodeus]|uniref:Uncharacterized protein n=1 Tax=Mucilaginibacter achroorhodeus TaxID=2599294 RepID=A0A563TY78_9SPHI|nr:hypothetical protein [Mucilaginibacter achroorhodeus]TWR24213.1 hypothetical protein FPZ42_17160 [Mucilaginibacter achroorhodeus]